MFKEVSIFIGNKNDYLVSLTIGSTTYTNQLITALVSTYSTVFSFVQNPNGQTDLAFQIDNSVPQVIGSFKEYSTNIAYGAQSWDYVGPRPKTRCPQCP